MNHIILADTLFGGFSVSLLDHEVYQCALSFLIACFLSIVSIPIIINLSALLNLTAKPGFRSSHHTDTPTLGGIALYASTLIAFFLWPHAAEIKDSNLTNLSMVGLTILFFLGLKDDILALDSTKKLLVQICASLTLVVMGDFKVDYLYGIFGWYYIPDWASVPLTIFIFIALINSINLIDGIDGLAGGISLIAGMGLGFWFLLNQHYTFACLAFSMSGSLLGFLRFNFSKTSKIFMGDTGSLVIGFLLSFFAIAFLRLNISYRNDPNAFFNAPIVVMVMLIVPIFDTLRVFIVRIVKGGSPFVADRNHMHHILIDNGLTHFQASFSLWMVTIINTTLFFLFHGDYSNTVSLYIYIGLFFVYMGVAYVLKKRATEQREKKKLVQTASFSDQNISMTKKILKDL
ncbi:glycosyltransferase family 4 protein [Telluribacter sp. SYSU D00476]|uniref:glycosyltransferase family 4 protein n=1 Tax=Telluribacter sp. SYSU D00476 TaxID=2811430 RepID=UPI001FF4F675|nr:MraY family glycosyltransferase [Telluribacter sp. SYSU D00476]